MSELTDGDKGDITVTSNGLVWTIDPNVVSNAKLSQVASGIIKGRATAGTGDVEDMSFAQVKTLLALTKADLGLSNVDNTSDANKPIPVSVQVALNAKQNSLTAGVGITIVNDVVSLEDGAGGGSGGSGGTIVRRFSMLDYDTFGDGVTPDDEAFSALKLDLFTFLQTTAAVAPQGQFVEVDLAGGVYALKDPFVIVNMEGVKVRNGCLIGVAGGSLSTTNPIVQIAEGANNCVLECLVVDGGKSYAAISARGTGARILHCFVYHFKGYGVGFLKAAVGGADRYIFGCTIQEWLNGDAEFRIDANYTATGLIFDDNDLNASNLIIRWSGCCMRFTDNSTTAVVTHCHFYNGGSGFLRRTRPKNIIYDIGAGGAQLSNIYIDNGEVDLYNDNIQFANCKILQNPSNSLLNYIICLFAWTPNENPYAFHATGFKIVSPSVSSGQVPLMIFRPYLSFTWAGDYTNFETTTGSGKEVRASWVVSKLATNSEPVLLLSSPGVNSSSGGVAFMDPTTQKDDPLLLPRVSPRGNYLRLTRHHFATVDWNTDNGDIPVMNVDSGTVLHLYGSGSINIILDAGIDRGFYYQVIIHNNGTATFVSSGGTAELTANNAALPLRTNGKGSIVDISGARNPNSNSADITLSGDLVPAVTLVDGPITSATQAALDLKAPINNPAFTGTVTGITKVMVGLANVDNTSDANKPISTAVQIALAAKASVDSPTFTGTVGGITKAMVGLGNVDNTPDATKPVSGPVLTELLLRAPIDSPTFTGTVGGITKSMVGLSNVNNTSDDDKPISIAVGAALDTKQDVLTPGTGITIVGNTISASGTGITDGNKGVISVSGGGTVWALNNNQVFNSNLVDMQTGTLKGRVTAGTGSPEDLTASQVKTILALTKADVGLTNVDNTADTAKPISTATQTALDLKAPLSSPTFTGTVSGITKAMVGLSNVDNTADLSKPISAAQQAALDLKQNVLTAGTGISIVGNLISSTGGGGGGTGVTDGNKGSLTVSGSGTAWFLNPGSVSNTELTAVSTATIKGRVSAGTGALEDLTASQVKTLIAITKTDVGLSNVDNTSDANKPISSATQAALDAKASLNSPTFTGTVAGITKAMVGLANVDNTADLSKPVSTAQQAALDTKAPLASPTFTGTVAGVTKAMVGLGSVDNTSDAGKPISTATQTALDLKAPLANPTFTGTVAGITKTMVGLANVDNTTDLTKPISTATQVALDAKAPLASPTFTGTVSGITKTMVGLANVDNTSDANKPVSSAQQAALNLKADLASPTFTGTVSGITKTMVGLANVDNTSDAGKPVSTATQTALNLKADLNSPAFTGTVTGITKASVGLSNVDNTTDLSKPISTATQVALDGKVAVSAVNAASGVAGLRADKKYFQPTKSRAGSGKMGFFGASRDLHNYPQWGCSPATYSRSGGVATIRTTIPFDRLTGHEFLLTRQETPGIEGVFRITTAVPESGGTRLTWPDARANLASISGSSDVKVNDRQGWSSAAGWATYMNSATNCRFRISGIAVGGEQLSGLTGATRLDKFIAEGPYDSVMLGGAGLGNSLAIGDYTVDQIYAQLCSQIEAIATVATTIYVATPVTPVDKLPSTNAYARGYIMIRKMYEELVTKYPFVRLIATGDLMNQSWSPPESATPAGVQNGWPDSSLIDPDGTHNAARSAARVGIAFADAVASETQDATPYNTILPDNRVINTGTDAGRKNSNFIKTWFGQVTGTTIASSAGVSGTVPDSNMTAEWRFRGSTATAVFSLKANPCGGTNVVIDINDTTPSGLGGYLQVTWAPPELKDALNNVSEVQGKFLDLYMPIAFGGQRWGVPLGDNIMHGGVMSVEAKILGTHAADSVEREIASCLSEAGEINMVGMNRTWGPDGISGVFRSPRFRAYTGVTFSSVKFVWIIHHAPSSIFPGGPGPYRVTLTPATRLDVNDTM